MLHAPRLPTLANKVHRQVRKHPFFQPSDRPTLHKRHSGLEELARSPGNDDERKQTEEGKLHT
ncbi:hypothetical protein HMPREF9997_01847 [Corynebacterium durum F0235]|uniref:Uncharacterized protein n=1 Tax=Corynebacterium durum F0235 TaxID=1035195 RepID=L1MEN2_9CORY|nr:hypothetical protein HMPREF9997_01847 [Corynebacterium durum F0235]